MQRFFALKQTLTDSLAVLIGKADKPGQARLCGDLWGNTCAEARGADVEPAVRVAHQDEFGTRKLACDMAKRMKMHEHRLGPATDKR